MSRKMLLSSAPFRAILFAAFLSIITACGAARSSDSDDLATGTRARSMVIVENHHWLDVTIYAVRAGHRIRLGTATGLSTSRLRVPSRFLGASGFYLLADPIGSNQPYRLPEIFIFPGEHAELALESVLQMSTVYVWR